MWAYTESHVYMPSYKTLENNAGTAKHYTQSLTRQPGFTLTDNEIK